MKRIVCITFAALLVVFLLTGCDNSSEEGNTTAPEINQPDAVANPNVNLLEDYPYDLLPPLEDAQIVSSLQTGGGGKIVFNTQMQYDDVCEHYKGILVDLSRFMETEDNGVYSLFAETDAYRCVVEIIDNGTGTQVTLIAR